MYIARKAGARFAWQQYTERTVDQKLKRKEEKYTWNIIVGFCDCLLDSFPPTCVRGEAFVLAPIFSIHFLALSSSYVSSLQGTSCPVEASYPSSTRILHGWPIYSEPPTSEDQAIRLLNLTRDHASRYRAPGSRALVTCTLPQFATPFVHETMGQV